MKNCILKRNMEKNNKKTINRRNFIKITGTAAVGTTAALYGCKPDKKASTATGSFANVPTDKMTYRTNHITGDEVSLLGYGCMRWPLRKNDKGEDEVDQDAVNELVDYALAHGLNYFDTAPVYVRGWSEKATGIALSRHPRDSYFIATKMSNHRMADLGLSNEEYYKRSVEMFHNSFKDLQVDYFDYYLLHSVGAGDGIPLFNKRFIDNGVLDFMLKERAAGRIRNLGFSFHGDVKVYDHLLNMDIQWDFVQIQMNYIDWDNATGRNVNASYLLGELEKRNIPAVIMEPLLGGRLSRIPAPAMELLKVKRPEASAASWAFRYAGTPESILTVLSGMVYMEHLQENIITYSPLDPIDETERDLLEKEVADIMLNADYIQCTACEYCMPCTYGIDIPGVFAHYNRCVTEGNRLKNSNDENYKKARRAFLVGYDQSVPRLRQANHCIACNECTHHCPQSIDIPKEMQRVDLYAEQLKQGAEF